MREHTVHLQLPSSFIGQLLDGLDVLIEEWKYTADYLETGLGRDDLCSHECSDANEDRAIAAYYQRVYDAIESQCRKA